ncbi:MAG: dTMP kinase [Actinobacteria bacterium]|nr:dTMP kinase [Actinomycetota bacterium]
MISYIAFEGIEGAGKSTAISAVESYLVDRGIVVTTVREPGATKVGEQIRSILLDQDIELDAWAEALLFAAARAHLVRKVVQPALDRGEVVLSDRSVFSSLAYQGGGRRLGVDRVRMVNAAGLGGIWPHRVVLLRVDAKTGLGRQHVADRIGSEGVEFQDRVAETFDSLVESDPERFAVIDASQTSDAVVQAVLREVQRWL